MSTRDVYHNPSSTDLGKLLSEAEGRARGDIRNDPSSTTIHLHPASQPCENQEHKEIEAKIEEGSVK